MSEARRGRPRPIVFGVGVSWWPTVAGLAVLVAHERLLATTYLRLRWTYATGGAGTTDARTTARALDLLDAAAWARSTTVVLGIAFVVVQAAGTQLRGGRSSVVGAAVYTVISALVQGAVAAVALAGAVLVGSVLAVEGRGGTVADLPGTPGSWRWGGLLALAVSLAALWVVAYSAARLVAALLAGPALVDKPA